MLEILIGLGVLLILKKLYANAKADSILFHVDSGRSSAQPSGSDDVFVEKAGDPGYRDPVDEIMAEWEDEIAQAEACDGADDDFPLR